MKAWQEIRKGITCRWRNDAYVGMYMLIVWNPLIKDLDGLMGTWGRSPDVEPRCSACGQLEGISHCLWECREAAAIWGGALRLLCHALTHLPSNGDMLVGIVLMMTWRNLITHAKQCTEGRMKRFDWSRITWHLQLMPKSRKLEIYGCCLHPLSHGAFGQQDVLGYFQQTNGLQQNL